MVARRTREIGIRLAWGAQPRDILSLVLLWGAGQTDLAVGFGLVLSLIIGVFLSDMLYHVGPVDPLALLVAVALLSTAAPAACWLPARRATKVSPLSALRTE